MIRRDHKGRFAKRAKVGNVIVLGALGGILALYGILYANAYIEPEVMVVEQVVEMPAPYVTKIDWNEERIIQEIEDTFPEDKETAVAIAKCESGSCVSFRPDAVNPEEHHGCRGSYGLMQIACIHYEGNYDDLKDVSANLRLARQIYEREGWRPWGVCHDGKVDCGL